MHGAGSRGNELRIFVDMDKVLVDFKSALRKKRLPDDYPNADNIAGIFSEMDPMPGAIEAYRDLVKQGHEVFILSTAPWDNPSSWSDKLEWVKRYLGDVAERRLILTHHKYLVR